MRLFFKLYLFANHVINVFIFFLKENFEISMFNLLPSKKHRAAFTVQYLADKTNKIRVLAFSISNYFYFYQHTSLNVAKNSTTPALRSYVTIKVWNNMCRVLLKQFCIHFFLAQSSLE